MTVTDLAGLVWVICHRLLQLLGQESTENLSQKKSKKSWEMNIAPRTMSCIIKQDLGQRLTFALKEDRKKNIKTLCCYSMVKSITKKSSLQMKQFLLWRKLSIRKQ